MNPWPLIHSSLSRYRLSAIAFVLLVAAGVSLSVAIVSQERALRAGSARAADRFDLIVAAPGSRTDALLTGVFLRPGSGSLLKPALTAALLNDHTAEFVSPLAFGDSYRGEPVIGVVSALVAHLSGPLAKGRIFAARNEAVVGAASLLKLGQSFHPAHGAHPGKDQAEFDHDADPHGVTLTVVGRMQPTGSPWDRAVTVPVELVWSLHDLPAGHAPPSQQLGPPFDPAYTPGIPAAVIRTDNLENAYKLRRAYTSSEAMAFFPAEALIQLYSVLGDMRQLVGLLALVTQALVLLSIVASVFILFRLLMPQFVTLRALGAPRRYIFAIAWGFTSLLIGVGVALGLAGGYVLSFAISTWLARLTGVTLEPTLGQGEFMLASSVLAVGLVLATLPAWRMQRQTLSVAMKTY